jgi:hypothetical protein
VSPVRYDLGFDISEAFFIVTTAKISSYMTRSYDKAFRSIWFHSWCQLDILPWGLRCIRPFLPTPGMPYTLHISVRIHSSLTTLCIQSRRPVNKVRLEEEKLNGKGRDLKSTSFSGL